MSDEIVKKAYEDMRTSWEEMKHLLETQAEEVKKLGEASAETKQSIEKVNVRIDQKETERTRPLKAAEVKAEIENKQNEAREVFQKFMRYGVSSLEKDEKELIKVARPGTDYEKKAVSVGDDTQAGFLAPPELVNDIIRAIVLYSPIRDVARVRPTSNRSVLLPVRTGNASASWVSEIGTRSATNNPTFGMQEIATHEMYAEVLISEQDLEDDQFNIENEIMLSISEQFGVAEGLSFVSGDGVKQPEGLLTNPNLTYTALGDANLITANGLISATYALKAPYAKNATWLMARATVGAIRQLVVNSTTANYVWQPGLTALAPSLILDRPFVETVDLPTVAANNFPILFGDFSRGYMIVDRVQMVVKRLQEKYAESGQIAYIVRKRVGGQVVLNEAIMKCKIATS